MTGIWTALGRWLKRCFPSGEEARTSLSPRARALLDIIDTLKLYVLLTVFGAPQVAGVFLITVPFSLRFAQNVALVFVALPSSRRS